MSVPEKFGLQLRLPKRVEFRDFSDDSPLFKLDVHQKLCARFKILSEVGDLVVVSSEDNGIVLGKCDRFIWNLWRKPPSETDGSALSSPAELVSSTTISSDLTAEAFNAIVEYMYTGTMTNDFKTVLEIATKMELSTQNELIQKKAEEMLQETTTLGILSDIWKSASEDLLERQVMVNHTVSFILQNPEMAFAVANGKITWKIPKILFKLLVPNHLGARIDEYKAATKKFRDFKTTVGLGGKLFLDMNHFILAEFLYLWAADSWKNDYKDLHREKKEMTASDLHMTLEDLVSLLNPDAFSIIKLVETNQDHHPIEFSKGMYYYSLLVLTQSSQNKSFIEAPPFPEVTFLPLAQISKQNYLPEKELQGPVKKKLKMQDENQQPLNTIQTTVLSITFNGETKSATLSLLENEFKTNELADTTFLVDNENAEVKANSFMLSLWSDTFSNHFKSDLSLNTVFNLGGISLKDCQAFVKAFYTGEIPKKNGVEMFLELAALFRIIPFIKVSLKKLTDKDIIPGNAVIRYMGEKAAGDRKRIETLLSYIKSNISGVLESESLVYHADKQLITEIASVAVPAEAEFQKIQSVWRWCKFQSTLIGVTALDASELMQEFKKYFLLENLQPDDLVVAYQEMKLVKDVKEYGDYCFLRGKNSVLK